MLASLTLRIDRLVGHLATPDFANHSEYKKKDNDATGELQTAGRGTYNLTGTDKGTTFSLQIATGHSIEQLAAPSPADNSDYNGRVKRTNNDAAVESQTAGSW